MVNIFWVWHSRSDKLQPVTFSPGGISFTLKKQKFEYMVYDENGLPDMDLIDRSVDKRFYIKYDPELMHDINRYEREHAGERFVKNAKLKVNIHRASENQTEEEQTYNKQVK